MENKVLLIVVDGMRPDSIPACGDEKFLEFYKSGTYCLKAQTTFPSATLPCHMSLFHSVDSGRHGITTNFYMPMVRPVKGLVEVLRDVKKFCGFVYTWEQLRDLCRPGKLEYCWYEHQHTDTDPAIISALEKKATREALQMIRQHEPDLVFLYLGGADAWGHSTGWMGREYLGCVKNAWECIQEICAALPEEYAVIITADHGGHDRVHGTELPEDMTIPVTFRGKCFEKGKQLEQLDIRDIAPTIVDILGVEPDLEWEGRSILR